MLSELASELSSSGILPFFKAVFLCLIVVIIGFVCQKSIKKLIDKYCREEDSGITVFFRRRVYSIAKVLIWVLVIGVCLKIIGLDLTPALAGLGISGLVVGIALQETFSNIIAGITAHNHGSIKVGDFVDLGSVSGTIVESNYYCVSLLTPDHRYITITNKTLWSTPITNYSVSHDRRIDIVINVACSADVEKIIAKACELLNSYPEVLHDKGIFTGISSVSKDGVEILVLPWSKPESYWDVYWRFQADMYRYMKESGNASPYTSLGIQIQNGSAVSVGNVSSVKVSPGNVASGDVAPGDVASGDVSSGV